MNSRSLRGTRLGSLSMETDEGVLAAPRQEAVYDCPNGHHIVLPFSVEADVPAVWECRCGATAVLRDHEKPEEKPGKPQRTHWDMLLERRDEKEGTRREHRIAADTTHGQQPRQRQDG